MDNLLTPHTVLSGSEYQFPNVTPCRGRLGRGKVEVVGNLDPVREAYHVMPIRLSSAFATS